MTSDMKLCRFCLANWGSSFDNIILSEAHVLNSESIAVANACLRSISIDSTFSFFSFDSRRSFVSHVLS